MTPPVLVALERGPSAYAALRVGADAAQRLGARLDGHALVPGAGSTVRALRRLSVASRRRGVEHAFVKPTETDLRSVSDAARAGSLLVLGRAPGDGNPSFVRRLALGRVLREPGPPVLVVPPRTRALGDVALLVVSGREARGLDAVCDLVAGLARSVVVVRVQALGEPLVPRPEVDRCLARVSSWSERIVREPGASWDLVLANARGLRPSLIVIAGPPPAGRLRSALAPGLAERAACESLWPVLVARPPISTAANAA
jgi:hypothetical protein